MEEIIKKYLNEGMSLNKIAKEIGKSLSTIRYWVKKYNLTPNFKNFKQIGKIEYGDYRYCSNCKENCNIEEFYKRRGIKHSSTYCKTCTNILSNIRHRLKKLSKPKSIKLPYKHTEENKKLLSEKRKQFLKDNPDKHPWKKSTKFLSTPCENFKNLLDELDIKYVPEYTISDDRLYSIDIAFPTRKIAIEINGNQHYNTNGTLKEYYQLRHNFIEELGYKIYELHYSLCFDKNKMNNLIKSIMVNEELFDFDYDKYLFTKLNPIDRLHKKCTCGKEIYFTASNCMQCSAFKRRKLYHPELSVLLEDVRTLGYRGTGKKYGVSDTSIKKWIKNKNGL